MASGIKKRFSIFVKILALVLICLILAFIIVWPLWKFATANSKVYTFIVLFLLAAAVVYSIILRIKKHGKKN